MRRRDFVLWFRELGKEDIPLVGGKCANLGELIGKIGVPVPNGFAISAYAYKAFLEKTKADKKIESLLSETDISDMERFRTSRKRSGSMSKVCQCQKRWKRRSCRSIRNSAKMQGEKILLLLSGLQLQPRICRVQVLPDSRTPS